MVNKFKVGDIIECVSDTYCVSNIVVGKHYTVTRVSDFGEDVYFDDDVGSARSRPCQHYRLAPPPPPKDLTPLFEAVKARAIALTLRGANRPYVDSYTRIEKNMLDALLASVGLKVTTKTTHDVAVVPV